MEIPKGYRNTFFKFLYFNRDKQFSLVKIKDTNIDELTDETLKIEPIHIVKYFNYICYGKTSPSESDEMNQLKYLHTLYTLLKKQYLISCHVKI